MSCPVVTCYKGGLTPCGEKLEKQDIWVREGRIVDPQQLFFRERKSPDYVINCSNHIVSPGFIDIQINGVYIFGSYHGRVLVCGLTIWLPSCVEWNAGGFGIDFSMLEPENMVQGLDTVAKGLLTHGVTSFCPTIVTSTPEYYSTVRKMSQVVLR